MHSEHNQDLLSTVFFYKMPFIEEETKEFLGKRKVGVGIFFDLSQYPASALRDGYRYPFACDYAASPMRWWL